MKTDIIYRDISRTDGLEEYILSHTQEFIENFFQDDEDAHLTVRIETDRHRADSRKPHYACELILKPTHIKKVYKVQKTDNSFKKCVAKSMAALRLIVRKTHDRKKNSSKKVAKRKLDL